ncbi:hypothetical protein GCK32_006803, partial [Trichostrongylus colubriformis]
HSFYVVVNCFLVNGSFKLLVDEILRELNLQPQGKVNTINALAVFLGKHLFSAKDHVKLTVVLDQAHYLSSFPVSTIKGLLSLPKSVRIAVEKYTEKHGDVNDIKNLKLLPVLEALDETDCYWQDENEREGFVDLPLSTRFLLVASFCASHNPSSTDKRYFAKFHGKEKRSEARERKAEQSAEQRDGEAKSAELQRIKCIYLALANLYPVKGVNMDIDVNSQIATLCSTGSVARTTSAANLDQPKFRCLESFENINEIAQ